MYFEVVGVVATLFVAVIILKNLLSGLKAFFLCCSWPWLTAPLDPTLIGKWAVVTGATDGIGRSYAKQLAEKGFNIVLISRSLEKLEHVSKSIETRFNVETRIIKAEFGEGYHLYKHLQKSLTDLDIGILVNNVGTVERPVRYETILKQPDFTKVAQKMLNVNVVSTLMMTDIVGKQLMEKNCGVIINMSSGLSFIPAPYVFLYPATKSFISCFTRSLQCEYAGTDVIIQLVEPGLVSTNMSMKDVGVFTPTPDQYVRQALGTVGVQQQTYGCWSHGLALTIFRWIPAAVADILIRHRADKHRLNHKKAEVEMNRMKNE